MIAAVNILDGQQSETAKPVEPDVLGELFYLDSAHAIQALPKEQWKAAKKPNSGSIELAGVSSSFRPPASDKSEFVFRLGTSTADPLRLTLYMCSQDRKKGLRRFWVVERKTGIRVQGVPFQMVKYGESSYKMILDRLAPGEYAFPLGPSVFSFSVQ